MTQAVSRDGDGDDANRWLLAVYRTLLHREPTTDELAEHRRRLPYDGEAKLVLEVLKTAEYRSGAVRLLFYQTGRDPSPAEVAAVESSGKSLASVRVDLLAADDFFDGLANRPTPVMMSAAV